MLRQIDEIREEWLSGEGYYVLKAREKLEVALHIVSLYFRHPLIMELTVDNSIRAERASIDMMKMILASQTGDEGFNQFKIEGRSLGSAIVLEMILYYMTKPEYQLKVREEIYLDSMLDLF